MPWGNPGTITLKDWRVEQPNFDAAQGIIEVDVVKSAGPPGGLVETGTFAIVPA